MSSGKRFFTGAALQLAWFSGYAALMQRRTGGAGAILRLEQVRPRRAAVFQPRLAHEITPEFLDRTIRALKRWNLDIVSIDEACRRAAEGKQERRFVCLTFDGATRDLKTFGYPVLAGHGVPFTVYVATAFPDRVGEAWWLGLEAVIARNDRLGLVMDGQERRFEAPDRERKHQLYGILERWMRTLPPPELSHAINDLCRRHGVDLAAISSEAFMDWADLASLAGDPNVTFASMTVHAPRLQSLDQAAALREMSMGRAVAEAALHRDIKHFAYPFGDVASFNRDHVKLAEQAGFSSAVTALPGIVQSDGRSALHALPRIAWDGRRRSLHALRALLSGVGLPKAHSVPRTQRTA